MIEEKKYCVVHNGKRVTDALTELEAKKVADELKKRLEESQAGGEAVEISVKVILLG